MVFSSLPFLFLFLTVVLLVSHILPFRFRNFFLLLANLVFYAYGEPVYVLIMIGSILVNFFAGLLMDKQSTQGAPGGAGGGHRAERLLLPRPRTAEQKGRCLTS